MSSSPAAQRERSTVPAGDRPVITPGQLRGAAQRAGQVKRFQDLHHFLRALQGPPPRARRQQDAAVSTGQSGHDRGEIRWPRAGRSGDRQWGEPMAAYGEIPMAAVTARMPLVPRPAAERRSGDRPPGSPRRRLDPPPPRAHRARAPWPMPYGKNKPRRAERRRATITKSDGDRDHRRRHRRQRGRPRRRARIYIWTGASPTPATYVEGTTHDIQFRRSIATPVAITAPPLS